MFAVRSNNRRDRRRIGALLVAIIIAALVGATMTPLAALADTAVPDGVQNAPETVSADPLPTVQINGVVWSQKIAGSWVYAGGEFTSARPPGAALGQQETPRSNFLRYDLATGALDTGYALPFNGVVRDIELSPDGNTLYVVGSFTKVGSTDRFRIAALNAQTGELLQHFTPGANGRVNGVAVAEDRIWVTGTFTQINSTQRTRIAALDAVHGNVLPFNAKLEGGPVPDAQSIVVSPDRTKVVVSGSFTTTNGSTNPGRGIAALDAVSGASLPWAMNSVLRNAGDRSSMMGLASDGDSVYGSGYSNGSTGNGFEGSFRASWSDGTLVWMEDCHGDTYDMAVDGNVVYKASHAHFCGNIGEFPQEQPWQFNHALAFSKEGAGRTITRDTLGYTSYTGQPAGRLLHWYPIFKPGTFTGANQATWTVTAGSGYAIFGGEFLTVEGVAQQGIVRFATKEIAPNKRGPIVQGGAYKITPSSVRANQVRVSFQANYDADNAKLTYELLRRGQTAPIASTTALSTRWIRPALTLIDPTAKSGQTYDYRIRVTDPFGNSTVSDWTSVTVKTGTASNRYNTAVMDSAPRAYWSLDEASGQTAFDWAGSNDIQLAKTTRAVAGQVVGEPSSATRFPGPSTGLFESGGSSGAAARSEAPSNQLSVEAWFRSTSTRGGAVVSFGASNTAPSSNADRMIYLSDRGVLSFGVNANGSKQAISTSPGYNDGAWHHVVGTLGPLGMSFFVDGALVDQRPTIASGGTQNGYWRIGSEQLSGWPEAGSSSYLAADIADVAIYDRQLTRDEVDRHWVQSGRTTTIAQPPLDAYGAAVFSLDPTLYWRFDETSGSRAQDAGPNGLAGVYQFTGRDVTGGVQGALAGVSSSAITLTPEQGWFGSWTNYQSVVTSRPMHTQTQYAIEGHFRTTTTAGGTLFNFGNSSANAINASSVHDRKVYMLENGRLVFGTYNGSISTITTPKAYNDDAWHHVVAQQSASGMELYVDGELIGTAPATTAEEYIGYWRVGGDTPWAAAPVFAGSIDEFAIYGGPLTPAEVARHHAYAAVGGGHEPPSSSFTAIVDTDQTVTVDGSASTVTAGSTATFAWSFGDGSSASGVTATHRYAQPGVYTVMLAVRDDADLRAVSSQQVVVARANTPPVAAFTSAVDQLTVAVDASTSADPDGSIVSYAWNFGDGGTASEAVTAHTYAHAGTYPVTLTVTDNNGGSALVRQDVTVTAPPAPNVPPVASFTAAPDGLAVHVDASASTDEDGTIASYGWDFGDGTQASGVQADHVYDSAGPRTITLTVTDDAGAVTTATRLVQFGVSDDLVAADAFDRVVQAGWGEADEGGAWRLTGGDAAFAVADGAGTIALAPSQTRLAALPGVRESATVSTLSFRVDQVPAGGAASVQVNGRQVDAASYAARVRLEPGGTIRLYLLQGESALGGRSFVLPGTYTAGEELTVQLSVAGVGETALGASVWRAGTERPADWQLTATDTTPALQAEGSIGIKTSVSGASTDARTTVSFTDLRVETPRTPDGPARNIAPTAAFTATTSGLDAHLDASGSLDPDGQIARYDWTFGDGRTGTGQTADVSYPVAGTYTVALTVTDDRGATASASQDVSVGADGVVTPIATDLFDRVVSSGWGSAGLGGDWQLSGGSPAFAVADGRGTITLQPSWTRLADLPAVAAAENVLITTTFAVDAAPAGTGAASVTVAGRVVGGSAYQARVRFETGGAVRLYILRDEVALGGGGFVLPGAVEPGADITVKLSVTGTGITTVAAKAWRSTEAEPAAWQLLGEDSTAALQQPGKIGVRAAVSSGVTNGPVRISFDSFTAATLG